MELRRNLKQRALEAFEEQFDAYGVNDLKGAQRVHGAMVRAAAAAGWVDGLTPEEVGDLTAKEVRRLSKAIDDLYQELVTLDPL